MSKKILSFILAVTLLLTFLPTGVIASNNYVTIDEIGIKYPADEVIVSGTSNFGMVSIKIIRPNGALFDVDSSYVASGKYSYRLTLPQNPEFGTYTVVVGVGEVVSNRTFVVKPFPVDDATLSSLEVDGEAIEGFSPFVYEYTVKLPNGTTKPKTITAVPSVSNAKLNITQATTVAKYGEDPVYSDKATVEVTAQDGVTKLKYTITFVEAPSSDASLRDLKVDGETVEGFASDVYEYTIFLPHDVVGPPQVDATANHAKAALEITQATTVAKFEKEPVASDKATVEVTAQDGTTELTYTVTFKKLPAPSSDATLGDLKVDGETVEGFAPDVYEYTVVLPRGTTEPQKVTTMPNNPNATLKVTPATTVAKYGEEPVDSDKATVEVTAQDGVTKLKYTIIFVEAPSSDARLKSIEYNSKTVPGFDADTFEYTVILAHNTTGVPTVTATAMDDHANVEITQAEAIAAHGTTPADRNKAEIKVTAQDGETKLTYKVAFIKEAAPYYPPFIPPVIPPEEDPELSEELVNEKIKKFEDSRTARQIEESIDDLELLIKIIADELEKTEETQPAKQMSQWAERIISAVSAFDSGDIVISDDDLFDYSKRTLYHALRAVVNSESAGADTMKVLRASEKLIDFMISASGEIQVTGETSGNKTSVTKDAINISNALLQADRALEAFGEIEKMANERKVPVKIDKKIVLDVQEAGSIAGVNVEVPAELFEGLLEKGIDSIEVKCELASVTIPLDFSSKIQDSQVVELRITEIKVDEDVLNAMSEEQRNTLGNITEIYEVELLIDGERISKFENNVSVKVPYALKANQRASNITTLYLAEDGLLENLSGRYDVQIDKVLFETNRSGKYAITDLLRTFPDVPDGHWARAAVESLAAKGIVDGREDGKFYPNDSVTRAEFAKMLTEAMNIVNDDAEVDFDDVSTNAWYYKYVASAANSGIIQGYDGNFMPNERISRQDMSLMVDRALLTTELINVDRFLEFNDRDEIANYASYAVAKATRYEILTGKPGNLMDPRGNATRAEAATIIFRFLNLQ